MTAISTILSVVMLPLNVYIYTKASYPADVLDSLDWVALGISLAVVVSAIGIGLFLSAKYGSVKFRSIMNKCGNIAGIGLIVFTSLAPEGGRITLSGREPIFYYGTIMPIVIGLLCSIIISSLAKLLKPERM